MVSWPEKSWIWHFYILQPLSFMSENLYWVCSGSLRVEISSDRCSQLCIHYCSLVSESILCLSEICAGVVFWLRAQHWYLAVLANAFWNWDPPRSVGSCNMKYNPTLKLNWILLCQGWSPRFVMLFRLAVRWTKQLYTSFSYPKLQKENIVTH